MLIKLGQWFEFEGGINRYGFGFYARLGKRAMIVSWPPEEAYQQPHGAQSE